MENGKEARPAVRPSAMGSIENGRAHRPTNQRVSFQSVDDQSIMSSAFHSPTSPGFPAESGLTPRPPSYSNKGNRVSGAMKSSSLRNSDSQNHGRPASWRHPDANGNAGAPTRERPRSFSARAGKLPTDFEENILNGDGLSPVDASQDAAQPPRRQLQTPEETGELMNPLSTHQTAEAQPRITRQATLEDPAHPDLSPQARAFRRSVSANSHPLSLPRREWAPDRSPLQRLEITLQGISKAEKRAELEEAELLAREARANHAGRRTRGAGSTPVRRASEATGSSSAPLAHAGLVRSLSNKQRDRIRRSTTVEVQKPKLDTQHRESSEGGEFEYEEQDVLDRSSSKQPEQTFTRTIPANEQSSQVADEPRPDSFYAGVAAGKRRAVSSGDTRGLQSPNWDADTITGTPLSAWQRYHEQNGSQQRSRRDSSAKQIDQRNLSTHSSYGTIDRNGRNIPEARIADTGSPMEPGRPEKRDEPVIARLTTSDLDLTAGRNGHASIAGKVPKVDTGQFDPPLWLTCGPLLRYLGIRQEPSTTASAQNNATVAANCEVWRGSVMIVTYDASSNQNSIPTLRLFSQPMTLLPAPPSHVDAAEGDLPPEHVDPIAGLEKVSRTGETVYVKPVDHLEEGRDASYLEGDEGLFEKSRSSWDANAPRGNAAGGHQQTPVGNSRIHSINGETLGKHKEIKGFRLHAERGVTFWRFPIEVELGQQQARIAYRINNGPAIGFWVPAKGETMNIMFHSCNGFSLRINPDHYSGPDPLWRDVLNAHQVRPFHVMIGGGNQIYNDAVMRQSEQFRSWYMMKNPHLEHGMDFTKEMQEELEGFYLKQYSEWFSQGLFGMATSQIPMVNIWDDHDIIDGYGSYAHRLMSSPVFSGLGTVAFKYYMLFQHQSLVTETSRDEPSWLLGANWGPYISELSRSVFMSLGNKVAFLGVDCRTERTRDDILSESTYALILNRCRKEIMRGETRHLIVLLSVPIAYPRLVWLENMSGSRLMDPVKALRRSGLLGSFADHFDGGGEILADLSDHWTASNHKEERRWFVQELQDLAAEKLVRVTIISGDVHLAAIGQFRCNPKLGIPKDQDCRYMPNIVSSPIANAPPSDMLADALNKRNKVHHLDLDTDEDMIPIFRHDVDGEPRNNKHLLPRRNWCSIKEYNPASTPPQTPPLFAAASPETTTRPVGTMKRTLSLSRKEMRPGNLLRRLSRRGSTRDDPNKAPRYVKEGPVPPDDAADDYFPSQETPVLSRAATSEGAPQRPGPIQRLTTGLLRGGSLRNGAKRSEPGTIRLEYGLDISLNVEVNQKDPAGITVPYRFLVPALWELSQDVHGERVQEEQIQGGQLAGRQFQGGQVQGVQAQEEQQETLSSVDEDDGNDRTRERDEGQVRRSWLSWGKRRSVSQAPAPPQGRAQAEFESDPDSDPLPAVDYNGPADTEDDDDEDESPRRMPDASAPRYEDVVAHEQALPRNNDASTRHTSRHLHHDDMRAARMIDERAGTQRPNMI